MFKIAQVRKYVDILKQGILITQNVDDMYVARKNTLHYCINYKRYIHRYAREI